MIGAIIITVMALALIRAEWRLVHLRKEFDEFADETVLAVAAIVQGHNLIAGHIMGHDPDSMDFSGSTGETTVH